MGNATYPDWWLEKAAVRKSVLQASVERIRSDAALLASVSGFLVFGSFARDEVGPESDLDIIAVMETDEPLVLRGLSVRKHLARIVDAPFDLIVYTPKEYDEYSERLPFVSDARREGIWIDAPASA